MMTFYGPSFETKVAAGLGRTRRSRAPYSRYREYRGEGVKAYALRTGVPLELGLAPLVQRCV